MVLRCWVLDSVSRLPVRSFYDVCLRRWHPTSSAACFGGTHIPAVAAAMGTAAPAIPACAGRFVTLELQCSSPSRHRRPVAGSASVHPRHPDPGHWGCRPCAPARQDASSVSFRRGMVAIASSLKPDSPCFGVARDPGFPPNFVHFFCPPRNLPFGHVSRLFLVFSGYQACASSTTSQYMRDILRARSEIPAVRERRARVGALFPNRKWPGVWEKGAGLFHGRWRTGPLNT